MLLQNNSKVIRKRGHPIGLTLNKDIENLALFGLGPSRIAISIGTKKQWVSYYLKRHPIKCRVEKRDKKLEELLSLLEIGVRTREELARAMGTSQCSISMYLQKCGIYLSYKDPYRERYHSMED